MTHQGSITVEEEALQPSRNGATADRGALSEETARWLGGWADGRITVATPDHEGLERRIEAFRERAPEKPVYAKVQLSYDDDEESALEGAYNQ